MKRLLLAVLTALCATAASAQLKVHVGHTGDDATGSAVASLVMVQMTQLGAQVVPDEESTYSIYLLTIRTEQGSTRSAISAAFVVGASYLRSSITTCPPNQVVECAKSIVADAVQTLKLYTDATRKSAPTGRSL